MFLLTIVYGESKTEVCYLIWVGTLVLQLIISGSINALFKNVSIFTHPTLDLPKALHLDISPSTIALQQSITINLPSTHNYLLVRPTTTEETPQRHIKLVASVGTQKIPLPVHTGLPESTSPVYELRLNRGVTRVDLEIIAGPSRTVSRSGPPGSEIEYERLTIFFHLMRPWTWVRKCALDNG
jgi:hypothetical protein